MFAQEKAIGFDAGPQQLGAVRNFTFHFRKQRVADVGIERRRIGMTRGRAGHRNAAAGALVQTERIGRARELKIDKLKAVRDYEANSSRQLIGDVLQPLPDQVAQLKPTHHRRAHRHGARADTVFLITGQIDQLTHPRQGVGQTRHRRSRKPASIGNFQVAEPGLMALEAAQYIESPRHHLNNVALPRQIAGELSLFAEPF